MGLKDLLNKVISGIAGDRSEATAAAAPREDEPIRTRTMAEVLVDQGHLERAIGILRELDGDDVVARRLELQARLACTAGVTLRREGAAAGIAWKLDDVGVERARLVLGSDGALALRVVRVGSDGRARTEDSAVEVVDSVGLEVSVGDVLVVSVGVRDGDRFVSIAHARA